MQSIQSAPAGGPRRSAPRSSRSSRRRPRGRPRDGRGGRGSGAGVVNVNTASVEELVRLPGIGESKARAIVDFRKERGAFKSVEQLREVKGIGDAALERIRSQVVIEGKTTLQ